MRDAFQKSLKSAIAVMAGSLRSRSYLAALGSSLALTAMSVVIQIGLVPFYLAHLGTVQFGILMMLLSFVNFAVIGIAWMSGGSLRLLGEHAGLDRPEEFRRAFAVIKFVYVIYGLALALILALIALAATHLIWCEASLADQDAARAGLIMTGTYLIFFYAASVDRLALTARKRQGVANSAQIAGMVASALLSIAALQWNTGIAGIMAAQIAGAIVSMVATRLALKQNMPGLTMVLPRAADRVIMRRLGGRTGLGFFVHGALLLLLSADTALVGLVGGPVAAANFYLVWKIGEVIAQLIWKLTEPLAPYFVHMDARGEHARIRTIVTTGFGAIAAIALVAALLYGLVGRQLVVLWVGEAKAPNDPLAYWLAGGAIFWIAIARLPIVVAGARLILKPLNIASAIEFVAKWAIAMALFPRFGFVALLIGINLAHTLFGAAYLYFRLLFAERKNPAATERRFRSVAL